MRDIPIIFGDPEFINPLQTAFPDTPVIPFALDVETCRVRIAELDQQSEKMVWMLYRPSGPYSANEPVKDHINLSTENTLIGPVDLSKGPRFPDMSSVYEHQGPGVIVVLGEDRELKNFNEAWSPVSGGVWEAIALKQRGYKIQAWLVADLEKWIHETRN